MKVTPELHAYIMARDRMCIAARISNDHVCRDRWGNVHPSTDIGRLTLDHVHDGYGLMGRRAPSDARHLVALCNSANVGVPSTALRQAERAYLAEAEPA